MILHPRVRLALFVSGAVLAGAALVYAAIARETGQPPFAVVPTVSSPIASTAGPAGVVRVGALAPDFEARLLRTGGGTLRLSHLRGTAVVMNFWASWCVPCRAEASDLEATHQRYKAQGLTFLGVDIAQDDWDEAMAFVKEFGITYPMVRDVTGKVTGMYQVVSIPSTFFIDREGTIRDKHLGPFLGDLGQQQLRTRIQALLK